LALIPSQTVLACLLLDYTLDSLFLAIRLAFMPSTRINSQRKWDVGESGERPMGQAMIKKLKQQREAAELVANAPKPDIHLGLDAP
jgi:hypothetical protein